MDYFWLLLAIAFFLLSGLLVQGMKYLNQEI